MFSVIGVIIVYLKGISAQEEARKKALEQQAQYQQDQKVNDNTLINIPQIEVNSDTWTVQTIKIGTGEKTTTNTGTNTTGTTIGTGE